MKLVSERNSYIFFLLPVFGIMALVAIYPLCYELYLSFKSYNALRPWYPREFVGFGNYLDAFSRPRVWYSLKITLGYVTGKEICLFPTLILDLVCCLHPFKIKTKSVQDHLDHDHLLTRKGQSFARFRYFGILIPNLSINSLMSFNQNISLGEG